MISYGQNIRQANDVLNKLSVEIVAQKIMNPKPQLKNLIDQLRTIAAIDPAKYRSLKVQLPYFVAANFKPSFRKIENFAFTQYFILDIDHLSDKHIEIEHVMNKMKNDSRILLAFKSPSNDGLKVFFKLSEKCYDAGKYTLFYKAFAQKFSQEYQLDQFVDKRTSDVSRACFYSYDEEAIYNANADLVDMNKFINFENELEIREIESEIRKYSKNIAKPDTNNELKQVLPDSLLEKVRETLNPNIKTKREKQIYVPEELELTIDLIKDKMLEHNIRTENIKSINYGKQFKFAIDKLWAEINLFYGKKGFTVVKTTKSGSNGDLADIVYKIMCSMFYGN